VIHDLQGLTTFVLGCRLNEWMMKRMLIKYAIIE